MKYLLENVSVRNELWIIMDGLCNSQLQTTELNT